MSYTIRLKSVSIECSFDWNKVANLEGACSKRMGFFAWLVEVDCGYMHIAQYDRVNGNFM